MEFSEETASLIKDLNSFRDELIRRLTNLQRVKHLEEESLLDDEPGDVASNLVAKERDLRDAISGSVDKEYIQKRLYQAREAFKATFPGLVGKQEDSVEKEIHKEIATKLNKISEASVKISKRLNVLDALQDRSMELNKNLQQSQWENRDLAAILENSREKSKVLQEAAQSNDETRHAQEKLDKVVKELVLRKSAFQSLIQASQVDWYSDPELLDLMVSLGEPTHV